MPRFKDHAVCIREIDWSETSQITVLLTRDHGKIRGLAKGSKRQSPSAIARFSGGIELLTRGQLVATTRRTSELATVTEWDLQDDYHFLRRHLDRQYLAMYAADITHFMIGDEDAYPNVFDALLQLLEALRNDAQSQAELLRFQLVLLRDTGYQPELQADVQTGEMLENRRTYTFDPTAGGLTTQTDDRDWQVRAETVVCLRQMMQSSTPPTAECDPAAFHRANRLLCSYIRALLDRELPTMRVLLG